MCLVCNEASDTNHYAVKSAIATMARGSMTRDRIELFTYDVRRELCDECSSERFHFIPTGTRPATGACRCGSERRLAEVTDTSLMRLVTQPNGDIVIVPVIGW